MVDIHSTVTWILNRTTASVLFLPESGVGELVEPMVWFYQQSTLLSQGKALMVHWSRYWLFGTI